MIDHAGINVSDWEKAKAFYDAALGPARREAALHGAGAISPAA